MTEADHSNNGGAKNSNCGCFLMNRIAPYWELVKPRVTLMVVLTSVVAFYLASSPPTDYWLMFQVAIGTGLLAAGSAALNQLLERGADGKMRRTWGRPLPSGRIQPKQARIFGFALLALGTGYLAWIAHFLTPLLGGLTVAIYLCLYTPLKRRTHLCTAVGAVAGALPPLMGWDRRPCILGCPGLGAVWHSADLAVSPTFLSIAWIYREDYRRGGFMMLPVSDVQGKRTGRFILGFSILLLLFTLVPATLGLAGNLYLVGALLLGSIFLLLAWRVAVSPSRQSAKRLLRASVIHLPLLLILMAIDKGGN